MKTFIIGSEGMGFHYGNKVFKYLLNKLYPNIIIENKNDDSCHFIMSSFFFHEEKQWNTQKKKYIYFSGESKIPPRNINAIYELYILSVINHNIRNSIYIPFVLYSPHLYKKRKYVNNERKYLIAYCNSNPVPIREKIFNLFIKKAGINKCHAYGKCYGGLYPLTKKSNIKGGWGDEELIDTYKNYKFVIAMENDSVPGYITEKIINAFYSGAIPIYWGDNIVTKFFNENAFINVNNYKNLEHCVNSVINMTDYQIKKMMNEPIYKNNALINLLNDDYNSRNGNVYLTEYMTRFKSWWDTSGGF